MKDQNHDQQHKLEAILSKHLGPVEAPEELWDRLESGRSAPRGQSATQAQRPRSQQPWLQWAAAAALVAITATIAWQWQSTSRLDSTEQLALDGLTASPARLTLVTDNAVETRKWIKAQSGIETLLPPLHEPQVKIQGARITENQVNGRLQPVAEIAYQVGEHQAVLLVTADRSNSKTYPNHEARTGGPNHSRVTSWNMRGHSFVLASAAPGREYVDACLLCHDPDFTRMKAPLL